MIVEVGRLGGSASAWSRRLCFEFKSYPEDSVVTRSEFVVGLELSSPYT